MMKTKQILFGLLLSVITLTANAHAIWIETNVKGAVGREQEVKIFYGEYAAGEFEETEKWYSDVNTFTLWLVAPDGSKKQLTYKAAGKYFTTSFTPDKTGVYVLTTGHSAKQIDGTYMYQFNASAAVAVGTTLATIPNATANNDLYLQPVKSTDSKFGKVKAFYKGKPAANIDIAVSGPTGWTKTFKTDENGEAKFDLLWKGTYALEGTYTVEEKGTHHEAAYENIWRCATVRLEQL
ncbi:DUF4198 domain-containing protein [Pseudochryseolinea flava]|uniref:Nickel uptake transporter family protein n=1 Tax=Pseudochryseolinea flava TaxID=2059302 RepID=A0A364Y239_9BACT|nr:DUF4198 domain-containing protein [Pseudochryseolinea flava]RAW00816.1 nickel uptake transporter family protein [Pseudochryseolinea flava]